MRRFFYLSFLIVFFGSCSNVAYKQVSYFKDLPPQGVIEEAIREQAKLKIQKGDILAIGITSLNEAASAIYNQGNISIATSADGTSKSAGVNGFLVDQEGKIQIPQLGSIKVEGMGTAEARTLLQQTLLKYLKEPVVSLRITNIKISVLGDVAKPGVYPIQNEKITLTDALSMAGDLNITALRKNVLLIREIDGKRQYVRYDLTSKELFNSPYYYLQNNDVLYIEPGNAKYSSVDSSYKNVGIILSALSLVALLIIQL